jgi:hypothetical protein
MQINKKALPDRKGLGREKVKNKKVLLFSCYNKKIFYLKL